MPARRYLDYRILSVVSRRNSQFDAYMSFNTPNKGRLANKAGGENRESGGLPVLCPVNTDALG